ncbi:MAG: glycosyltransferase [Anaerolineae bacterium]|nr:glycosyltransferase [Anaerolineae bacterium]
MQTPRFAGRGWRLLGPNSVVMARGPDSFGLVGAVLGVLAGKKRFAKYAGQWSAFPGERLPARLQRWFYASSLWGGPVFANAAPDPRRPRLVSILNASLSRQDWQQAEQGSHAREHTGPLRLLFAGRITPAKGIDTLLRAVALCVQAQHAVQLDVVGDGSERPAAEKLAKALDLGACVTFHGWVGRAALFEHYRQADTFLSGSRHQGLDKVVLEAMSFGLPIVATDISVMPFLVQPPRCGLLVPPDDPPAMAQAIQTLLVAPQQRTQMGQNARARSADFLFEDLEVRFRQMLREHLRLAV